MKAVRFLGDRRLEVAEVETPTPGMGQVLVQVRTSGICGTDVHFYRLPSQPTEKSYFTLPTVAPGHEPVGVIVRVGPGIPSSRIGQRVLVHQFVGCEHCSWCRRGAPQHCPDRQVIGRHLHGSLAEYMIASSRNALLLPDDVTDPIGALMACTFGTAYAACRKASPRPDETVVVFGLGPVGLSCVVVAAAMGARVIGVDLSAHRAALAKELGASESIVAESEDVLGRIAQITGGRGPAVVFEVTGTTSGQIAALEAVAHQGRAVFLGVGGPLEFEPLTQLILKDLTVIGSYTWKFPDFDGILALARQHASSLERMVDRVYPAAEIAEAMRVVDERQAGKILIRWS